MNQARKRIISAFDELTSAVEHCPETKTKQKAFSIASLSPTDAKLHEKQMDDFRCECLRAAKSQCVLMVALIV